MNDARNRKVALAVIVGIAVVGVALAMRGKARPRPMSNSSGVELRLRGNATSARIRFTAPGGMVNDTVRLPWGYQLPAVAGQAVSVNATGTGAGGELTCEIMVRGAVWRTMTASGSSPVVSCEGVIGAQ